MENRIERVNIRLEPTIRTAMNKAFQAGESESSYVRRLIIEDLRTKGLLSDATLASLVC